MITYPRAMDENGDVHSIDSITQENRYDHRFFCLGCGKEMVPVLTKSGREQHFRHKVNEGTCNRETYLHNLGKKTLAKMFETQDQFLVSYYATNECPHKDICQVFNRFHNEKCSGTTLQTVDLKMKYDTFEIEGSWDGFRADVLLTSSKDPDLKPIFLEVAVSHDCTPEKIASGNQIIEIKVEKEEDIERPIVENLGDMVPITDERYYYQYRNYQIYKPVRLFIMFHNFEKTLHMDDLWKLDAFVVFDDGRHAQQEGFLPCSSAGKKYLKHSVFELGLLRENLQGRKPKHDFYNLGLSQALLHDHPMRHCTYCAKYRNCLIPVSVSAVNARTGQPVKVPYNIYNASLRPDQIDRYKKAASCPDWRVNTKKCHEVLFGYGENNVFVWSAAEKQ